MTHKVLPTLKMKKTIDLKGDGFTSEDVLNLGKKIIKTVKKVKDTLSKRKSGLFPPAVRKFLEKDGDTPITSAEIIRTPLTGFLVKAFNMASHNELKHALEINGYDKAFHLAIVLNGNRMLDKQEVIKISPPKIRKDTEKISISVPSGITFQSLLEKTKEYMGNSDFSNYNAKTNNCQDFIMAVLNSNGMNSPTVTEFVKQDAVKIFEGLPKYMESIAKVATDIGAVANKLIEGESLKKKRGRPSKTDQSEKLTWKTYLGTHMRGKKFSNREEANTYFKKLADEYKKLKYI
jgi:hypothetical protein